MEAKDIVIEITDDEVEDRKAALEFFQATLMAWLSKLSPTQLAAFLKEVAGTTRPVRSQDNKVIILLTIGEGESVSSHTCSNQLDIPLRYHNDGNPAGLDAVFQTLLGGGRAGTRAHQLRRLRRLRQRIRAREAPAAPKQLALRREHNARLRALHHVHTD